MASTDNEPKALGVSKMIELIASSPTMDSNLENRLAAFMQKAEMSDKLLCLSRLLSDERASCRVLGLRVLRRSVRQREILDKVVEQSFSVKRYGEIECWYQAILARYPVMRLARHLRREIEARGDPDFEALHIRAVEMCRVPNAALKREALKLLKDRGEPVQ